MTDAHVSNMFNFVCCTWNCCGEFQKCYCHLGKWKATHIDFCEIFNNRILDVRPSWIIVVQHQARCFGMWLFPIDIFTVTVLCPGTPFPLIQKNYYDYGLVCVRRVKFLQQCNVFCKNFQIGETLIMWQ